MWFKTRVGLSHIGTDFEVRSYRSEHGGSWWVLAYARSGEAEAKTLLRSFRFGGSWFYLAAFSDRAGVSVEIGETMDVIAKAVASGVAICDLSQMGSDDAWGGKWQTIHWPQADPMR